MAIIFGRFTKLIHEQPGQCVHLFRMHGGDMIRAVYAGSQEAQMLHKAQFQLTGEWKKSPAYGRQFIINTYKKTAVTQHKKARNFDEYN